jgi:putative hydrolase of the HAD superfamily
VRLPANVVLDLDDTLYLERDYVLSGLKAASERVMGAQPPQLFESARALFLGGLREKVFDGALSELGIEPDEGLVRRLVLAYREHDPKIELCADARRFFERRGGGGAVGLISDGRPAAQERKLAALGVRERFDRIVLTGRWGRPFSKPHRRAFDEMARRLGGPTEDFVYVADNPAKDFVTAKRLGWRTVRVVRGEGLYGGPAASGEYAADRTIESLDELSWRG